jgi:hypothetical protein
MPDVSGWQRGGRTSSLRAMRLGAGRTVSQPVTQEASWMPGVFRPVMTVDRDLPPPFATRSRWSIFVPSSASTSVSLAPTNVCLAPHTTIFHTPSIRSHVGGPRLTIWLDVTDLWATAT